MADYTRLIEFKVKDTDLNRAVNKLIKTLTRIDKTLVGIDKKLDHIAKQGFGFVAKEANKAEKSVSKLGKTLKNLSSPQGLAGAAVTKGFNLLGGGKGEIARRVSELAAFDGVLRKITNGNTGLPAFNRRVIEASTALAGFGLAHAGAITGIAAGGIAVVKGTELFYNLGKGVRQAEANLIDFLKTSKQVGLGQNLRSLLPSFKPGSRLGGADSRFLPGGMGIDGKAMEEATRLTGQSSRIVLESLRSRGQALANNKKIQENLVALTGKHLQATIQVKRSQVQYNLELAKTRLVQAAVTADIWAAQKAWQGVIGTLKGAGNLLGGLLGGKQGSLGQAAGVIGITRAIEALTGKLGFLNKAWINNTKAAAHWTSRVTEAVTTVGVAYTGLSTALGAASWTIGAIAGFKKWESEAAQAIWRTNRQVKNLVDNLGAMFWMMQGKGGTAGGVGSLLKDMTLGGLERQENKRFAEQGPTHLQNLQRDLDLQITKLRQRNTTESDYIQILQSKMQLEREIRRETKKQKVMEVKAGKPFEKVFADEIAAADKRKMERLREYNKERETSIKKGDKLIKDANTRIAKAGQDRLKEVQSRWRIEATNHGKELKRIRERQRLEKQRTADRRAAMSRFGENVMLGAGFPMLFGGGPGAVAGGLTGAIGQSALGSKGFGMQIFFSAIGQQIDAFVGKTADLGKAFNELNPDVDAVIGALGETNTVFGKHLEMLKKIKGEAAAMAAATEKLAQLIGQQGVNSLKQFGNDAQDFGNEMGKAFTLIRASVAELINSSGILLSLTSAISKANRFSVFQSRVKDIKASGTSFGDLSKDQQDIMDLAGLRQGILDNQGGDKMKQWIRENVVRLTNFVPEGMGGKSIEEFLSRSPGQREALTNIDNEIDAAMKRILAGENVGTLLGKGADKIADLNAQKQKLEEIFILGEKQAEIEEKIRNMKKDGITLTEKEYRKKLEMLDAQRELNAVYKQIGQTIEDGLVSAIEGAIQGTKTLGDVARSVFNQIASQMLRLGINSLLGGIPGIGGMFKAEGGPVKGGSPYIVGEKGPELFVPGSSGNIVPNHAMGGANVVVNVDATGSSVEGDAGQAEQLGSMLAAAVQAEIANQQRPGGLLARR